ncbi:unnamed protein product [Symbiodinium natans]|uniref:Uncharacterized protein n=1 Tax=Symbiodinium natans TaxID=878477 RepID=A0A812NA17_9DINO|nr:unnamed protein product [Symbiodinium natans]
MSSVVVENAVTGTLICERTVFPDMTVKQLQDAVQSALQDSGSAIGFGKITLLHEGSFLTVGGHTLEQAGLHGTCLVQALQCQRALMAAACDDKHIALVDSETHLALHSFVAHSRAVLCVAFAPGGRFLASGSQDNTARIWEVSQDMPCIQVLTGHQDAVAALAFTPDGGRLLTGSWDETAKLWCWEAGVCLLTFSGHTKSVNSVSISSDGRLIATSSNDETARVWCSEGGNGLLSLCGHQHFVVSAKFSQDASTILTASLDRTARLWDVKDGRCSVIFAGHASFVQHADFSWDGHLVITASEDETAKIWHVSGVCLCTVLGHDAGHCRELIHAAFGPQDQMVLASYGGQIHFWQQAASASEAPRLLGTTALRHRCLNGVAYFWPGTDA